MPDALTQDNIITTTAEWMAGIEVPGMPVNYRVPAEVVRAVLLTCVDVVGFLAAGDGGGEVEKANMRG